MFKNKNKGFTIVELIVVIAIILVLVLIAGLGLSNYKDKAKHIRLVNNAKVIQQAAERYYIDSDDVDEDSKWPKKQATDEDGSLSFDSEGKPIYLSYSKEQVELFDKNKIIYDSNGKRADLDPNGEYFEVDFEKLSYYVSVSKKDAKNYIIQNPVGDVYLIEDLTEIGEDKKLVFQKPTALINTNLEKIYVGQNIIFSYTPGKDSKGNNFEIIDYEWKDLKSSYSEAGTYKVSLRVKDKYAWGDWIEKEIVVFDKPKAVITLSTEDIYTSTNLTYSYSESIDFGGEEIVEAIWSNNLSNFSEPGVYTIGLMVKNESGIWSNESTLDIFVKGTLVFDYSSTQRSYTIPKDGNYILSLNGSNGASYGSFIGGRGGNVTARFSFKKGDVLYINTGSQGSAFGGASDIRLNGTADANRILVAGGGGAANAGTNGGDGGGGNQLYFGTVGSVTPYQKPIEHLSSWVIPFNYYFDTWKDGQIDFGTYDLTNAYEISMNYSSDPWSYDSTKAYWLQWMHSYLCLGGNDWRDALRKTLVGSAAIQVGGAVNAFISSTSLVWDVSSITGNQRIYTSIEGSGINYNHKHNLTMGNIVLKYRTYTYETAYNYVASIGGSNYISSTGTIISNVVGWSNANGKATIDLY